MQPVRGGEPKFAPRRVDGIDISRLPLTPTEAFVLSQLDGATELAEVAIVTNLSEEQVAGALKRLGELGAIVGAASSSAVRAAPRRDPRRDEDDATSIPLEERLGRARAEKDVAKPAESPEPEEEIDIDPERRQRIDAVHARLETLSHYQLLEVSPSVDKKEIKNAYFAVIKLFHPDKYFGKRLGSYKKKLDQIFGRLTVAYEVLTRQEKRDEYDRYLQIRKATRSLDAVLSSIPPPPPSSKKPPADAPAAATGERERASVPDTRSAAEIEAERRRQLAKRLAVSSSPAKAPEIKQSPQQALESLRQLVTPRREAGRAQQVSKFKQAGIDALEEKHYVSAVNALRIALSITPEDEALRSLLEQAEQKAALELAESYQTRASYEEDNKDYAAAARSYERVAAGRPTDPKPLEKAAQCILRAGTDPRQAVTFARRAVGLAPKTAAFRLTLARAYEASGLLNSAIGELTRAKELAPSDAEIAEYAKRLTKAKR